MLPYLEKPVTYDNNYPFNSENPIPVYDIAQGKCIECSIVDENKEYNRSFEKEQCHMSARTYYQFSREEFEDEINSIAQSKGLRLRNITQDKHKELQYELTTINPAVRIIIYSTLSPRAEEARSVGEDAIRIMFWAFDKDKKVCYKKFKTRILRIQTVFKNIDKAIDEANTFVYGEEIKKWFYAMGHRNFADWKK
jgi:hypothetical protein